MRAMRAWTDTLAVQHAILRLLQRTLNDASHRDNCSHNGSSADDTVEFFDD